MNININYGLIGSRICQRRKELHITQKKLAEQIDISNNHISGIETGEKKPSLETLLIICDALDISVDYLLNGTIYSGVDKEITGKIKLCSIEDRKRISAIIDVFLEQNKLAK